MGMMLTSSIVPVHSAGIVFVANAAPVDAMGYQVPLHFGGRPYDNFPHAMHDGARNLGGSHAQTLVRHDHERFRITVQDHADRRATGREVAVHGLGQVVYRLFDIFRRRPVRPERGYIGLRVKEMTTHSSVLAWRIPGMAEPGGLPSMGSHRVGHN